MNPATSSALDPKLKEVYDRVMGTSVAPAPSQQQNLNTSTQSTAPTQPQAPLPPTNGVTSNSSPQHVVATPTAPVAVAAAPAQPTSPVPPPRPASVTGTQQKSAVDYAALAAKYATTPPAQSAPETSTPAPEKHAVVTPSTTTYGVVNGGNTAKKTPQFDSDEKKGGALKKVMLILGILMFLVIYTFVWIVVFGFELPF